MLLTVRILFLLYQCLNCIVLYFTNLSHFLPNAEPRFPALLQTLFRGGTPNNAHELRGEIVQIKLDQKVGGEGMEVGIFPEKKVGDEGDQDEKVSVLKGR